ncbi:monothiol glutaredoxin-S12, chloroplastic-like [Carex rostrata]
MAAPAQISCFDPFMSPALTSRKPNITFSLFSTSFTSLSLSQSKTQTRTQTQTQRSSRHRVHASIRKLSEVESIPIPRDPEQQLDERIPVGAGVYGVYDSNGRLHYIGTSKCISNSIKKHRRLIPGMCYSVKVGPTGKGKPERDALRNAFNAWMGEHMSSTGGRIPPGNESKSHIWSPPPRTLLLESEHLGLTESLDQLLKKHHMVVFIHGPPRKVMKEQDFEYGASTLTLGLLVSHGFDFVTIDLVEECHSGLEKCLLDHSGSDTCPQVFVGGKFVGGEETIWKLAERGKLHTLC